MFAAVAMISAVSCNKDLMNGPVVADKAVKTLTAMFDGAETKALLSEGTKTDWEYLDTILVYNGEYSVKYVNRTKGQSRVAEFELLDDYYFEGEEFLAVYPLWADGYMTSVADLDYKTVDKVWLENVQTARAGSYDPRAAISMAYTEDTTLVFKNATALLKFQVLNEDVQSVTLWSHDGEPLTGQWMLDYNEGEPLATPIEPSEEGQVTTMSWVELNAGYDVFEVGKDYYIAVFPQVLEYGFTVEFNFKGTTQKLAVKSYNDEISFNRNVILNLGALEFTGEIPTPDDNWYLVGSFNDWTTGDEAYMMDFNGEEYVYYGFSFDEPQELKFNAGSWDFERGGDSNYFVANKAMNLWEGGENIKVPAGTFDIYLSADASSVRFEGEYVSTETWYLAGDFNNWTVADEAYVMEFDGEEYAYYGLVLDSPSGLKLNAGSWDVERGGSSDYFATYEDMYLYAGGENIKVPAGEYDVFVNAETSTIRFEGESYEVPEYTWYLVGTFNDWTLADEAYMMEFVDGWYVCDLTLDKATELKFNIGSWDVNRGGATFELDTDLNVWHEGGNIAVPAGSYVVYLSADASIVRFEGETSSGDEPVAPADTWYLVGEFNGWVTGDVAYQMEWNGKYLVYEGLTLDADQKLKFNAGNWDKNRGGKFAENVAVKVNQNGADIVVPAGTYDVYLSADTYTAYFMTDGKTPDSADEPEPVGETWYLVGDFNGWTPGDDAFGMKKEGDYYVFYGFESTGNELKFNAGDWSNNRGGDSFAVGSPVSLCSDGANIYVEAGTYDIYLNMNTDTAWFMTEGSRP